MRKKKKKEMTERAIRRLLNRIEQLTGGKDEAKAIELLEIATDNKWQDVYDNEEKQSFGNKNIGKNYKKTENEYPQVTVEGLKKYFGGIE